MKKSVTVSVAGEMPFYLRTSSQLRKNTFHRRCTSSSHNIVGSSAMSQVFDFDLGRGNLGENLSVNQEGLQVKWSGHILSVESVLEKFFKFSSSREPPKL